MARPLRVDYPGARHHVMNRSVDRQDIFSNDATCALFLDALADVPRLFGARIHGYALMPNHYHLMIEVPRANLSDVMKYVAVVFTQAYNRAHQRDGAVFRGRYHNAVVTDDAYWMHLLAYLHLNPVKAHLCKSAEECLWTSHQAYLDPKLAPEWLTTEELLGMFGTRRRLKNYVDGVLDKSRQAPEGFDPDRFFQASRGAEPPEKPEAKLRTWEQTLQDVADVFGVKVEEVTARPRGRTVNAPAWVSVWWALLSTGMSQAAIARQMGLSPGRIAQLRDKAHRLAKEDPEVAKAMEKLEAMLG